MASEVVTQLRGIVGADKFDQASSELVDHWIDKGIGADAVDDVFMFMEDHPEIDFGSPGALVHFIERFYGPAYKHSLLASLMRKPTPHTVWLLNRVISAEREPRERGVYVSLMQRMGDDPSLAVAIRQRARHFAGLNDR